MEQLKAKFAELEQREQRILVIGAILLVIMLFYVLIWQPVSSERAQLQADVAMKQDDLIYMQTASVQLRQLMSDPSSSAGDRNRSLLAVVDQQLASNNLKGATQRMEPDGTDGVRIWMNQANFNQVVTLLGGLEQNSSVGVKSMTVTPTDVSGHVDLRLSLER